MKNEVGEGRTMNSTSTDTSTSTTWYWYACPENTTRLDYA